MRICEKVQANTPSLMVIKLKELLYLTEKEHDTLQEIEGNLGLYYDSVYRSIEMLKELGLGNLEINSATKPPSSVTKLTDKGQLVAQKLKEVEMLLQSQVPISQLILYDGNSI